MIRANRVRTLQTVTCSRAPVDAVSHLCEAYARAVNSSDADAYAALFAPGAIRMPPDRRPERGRDEIRAGEQADYEEARLEIGSAPVDVLQIADDWIYAVAAVEGTSTSHASAQTTSFRVTKTWLLQRQPSGEWLIMRQMWNRRP